MPKHVEPQLPVSESPEAFQALTRRLIVGTRFSWALLLLGVVATIILWNVARENAAQRDRERFDQLCAQVRRDIAEVVRNGERGLRGAAAIVSPDAVTDITAWQAYLDQLAVSKLYPEISTIGFVARVPAWQRSAFVRDARKSIKSDYEIWPDDPTRDEYLPIKLVAPMPAEAEWLGFDFAADELRREASWLACERGEAVLTSKLHLNTREQRQEVISMILPVYVGNIPIDTPENRRAAVRGWAFARFPVRALFDRIFQPGLADIDVEVFDGSTMDEESLLYDLDGVQHFQSGGRRSEFARTDVVIVSGRTWTVYCSASPAFAGPALGRQPLVVLVVGFALTIVGFGLASMQSNARRQAHLLAEQMTTRLRLQ
jgi:CHASE1-domain containing sensor protein